MYNLSDTEICVWESELGCWWYTNADDYPYMYNHDLGQWFYFSPQSEAGTRYFWSFELNDYVTGDSLAME